MQQFIKKHQARITGTLSGLDRVRFRGTIRMLAYVGRLSGWLNDRRVLLKEFKDFSMSLTDTLKSCVTTLTETARRPVRYLASSALSKEDLARELLRRDGIDPDILPTRCGREIRRRCVTHQAILLQRLGLRLPRQKKD